MNSMQELTGAVSRATGVELGVSCDRGQWQLTRVFRHGTEAVTPRYTKGEMRAYLNGMLRGSAYTLGAHRHVETVR